jgi:hypothetical protein
MAPPLYQVVDHLTNLHHPFQMDFVPQTTQASKTIGFPFPFSIDFLMIGRSVITVT